MSAAIKIANWVQEKPMILIRFDENISKYLHYSPQRLAHTTAARPHSVFQDFKLPTLCLVEMQVQEQTQCYLATAIRKIPVSTLDSRLTLKKFCEIKPQSLQQIKTKLSEQGMKILSNKNVPAEREFSLLSPNISVQLIKMLAEDSSNQTALNTALSLLSLLSSQHIPNIWAQQNAIQFAIAAFNTRSNTIPDKIVLKRGASSSLSLFGTHLYEDNVIRADASQLPGFDAIAPDVTGKAIFQKIGERLVIYTANKLPLEKMFGVDLIYINETRGNIVMIQYKMLEEYQQKSGSSDWLLRPNKQLRDEITRMQLPLFTDPLTDYRLNRNPFFFKFVKRKAVNDSHQSFLLSLDHVNQILAAPESKGVRGGTRISYKGLNGIYLREADMLGLIRSGYIGTHRAETDALATIIDRASRGDKAVVLGWQHKT